MMNTYSLLLYADDIAIIAHSEYDLQALLETTYNWGQNGGIITIASRPKSYISARELLLQQITHFLLGQTLF